MNADTPESVTLVPIARIEVLNSRDRNMKIFEESRQNSERMRCNQWDHAIATESKLVHPVGQPISASTNRGFNVRR